VLRHMADWDLLVFPSVNYSSETKGAALVISRAEKQGLVRSRIDVFFQVINDFVILETFDVKTEPGIVERLTIRISCKWPARSFP